MQINRVPVATTDPNNSFALDNRSLDTLRVQANRDPKAAVRKVAGEFEAMFLNTLMQAMRQTSFSDEEDSSAMSSYKGFLDQQMVQSIAKGKGMGLGDALAEQISRSTGLPAEGVSDAQKNARMGVVPETGLPRFNGSVQSPVGGLESWLSFQKPAIAKALARLKALGVDTQERVEKPAAVQSSSQPLASSEFVANLAPHATQAAQSIGVSPHLIVAHAALESGWGKRNIRHSNGQDSHNLFGIKATGNWKGNTVDVMTTEYVDGVAQKRVERFRSYGSYSEAFSDYANLLKSNPRYKEALNKGGDAVGFAQALARGGYATDPNYASKLSQVATSNKLMVAMR